MEGDKTHIYMYLHCICIKKQCQNRHLHTGQPITYLFNLPQLLDLLLTPAVDHLPPVSPPKQDACHNVLILATNPYSFAKRQAGKSSKSL